MHSRTPTCSERTPLSRCIDRCAKAAGGQPSPAIRGSVVRAASLKVAIAQLRDLARANCDRSSSQALAANITLLRTLGVDEETLDLVTEMALAQNLDEEMTAAINYLASGFLLALLTLREEGSLCARTSLRVS